MKKTSGLSSIFAGIRRRRSSWSGIRIGGLGRGVGERRLSSFRMWILSVAISGPARLAGSTVRVDSVRGDSGPARLAGPTFRVDSVRARFRSGSARRTYFWRLCHESSSFPPRRRRVARPALARRARAAARLRRTDKTPAAHDSHLHAAGPAYAASVSRKGWQGLPGHSLSRCAERVARRLHRHVRADASGCGLESRFAFQFSDRGAASRAACRVPQQHFPRSIRGRAHWRRDALPQPCRCRARGSVSPGLAAAPRAVRLLFAFKRVCPAIPRR